MLEDADTFTHHRWMMFLAKQSCVFEYNIGLISLCNWIDRYQWAMFILMGAANFHGVLYFSMSM